MGFDLALGGLVLISAIRGWLKGFLVQAIRLGGLVAAVFAAAPVRDQTRVYVVEYLPTMRADLIDRLLWWVAAGVSYFVIVGLASLALSVSRRQTFGISEPNRNDQFAGMGLGLIKGLIVASFLVASIQKYAESQIAQSAWASEQIHASIAWDWSTRYQPAARIWSAPPVQRFVEHVQKMGLMAPATSPGSGTANQVTQAATPLTDLDASAMGIDPALLRSAGAIKDSLTPANPETDPSK